MKDFEMSLICKHLYFRVAQPLDLGLAVGDHRCCRMLTRSPRCNLQVWGCNRAKQRAQRNQHTSFGRVASSEMLQRKRLQQTPRANTTHHPFQITSDTAYFSRPNWPWCPLCRPLRLEPWVWLLGPAARRRRVGPSGAFRFRPGRQNDNSKKERQVGKHGLFLLQNSYYIICR